MKLLGDGGTPKLLVIKGELKSSISLLSKIPVEFDINLEPKLGEEKEHDSIYKYKKKMVCIFCVKFVFIYFWLKQPSISIGCKKVCKVSKIRVEDQIQSRVDQSW